MMQKLRQALLKTGSLLTSSSLAHLTTPAAYCSAQLEPRVVTSVISLRSFMQHSWIAHSPATAPAQAPPQPSRSAAAPLPPWTPTRELRKRKALPKRMQHLLTTLEGEREQEVVGEQQRPDFGPGDVVELKLSVPENKRRVTTFKGICIARRNRSIRTTFTLRNLYGASGGIERTFPLYSPHVLEMRVLERRKVRRAKLFYLRERSAKEYRT